MAQPMKMNELQNDLDTRHPNGTHVWMRYGDGSSPFAFLVPRVFVLSDSEVLLTQMLDNPFYLILRVDGMEETDDIVTLHDGPREVRLSAATPAAQKPLEGRVKQAFREGYLEFMRGDTTVEPPMLPEATEDAADVTNGEDTPNTSTAPTQEPATTEGTAPKADGIAAEEKPLDANQEGNQ